MAPAPSPTPRAGSAPHGWAWDSRPPERTSWLPPVWEGALPLQTAAPPSSASPPCSPLLPPPAPLPAAGCSSASPAAAAPSTHRSAERSQARRTRSPADCVHAQHRTTSVATHPAGHPYHVFSVAALPPSPHNEGQGAEGRLVPCHQHSLILLASHPSCPADLCSPHPALLTPCCGAAQPGTDVMLLTEVPTRLSWEMTKTGNYWE